MKNKFLTLIFALGGYAAYSQVGIGTQSPNQSAQLEVVASDKGILIPRVELTSVTDNTTIESGNVNSLLVFNTANKVDVKPGYYYWLDAKWNRIVIDGDVKAAAGSVVFNSVTKEFSYINEAGKTVIINIEEFVKKYETITILRKNGNGTYTYTNEAGDAVDIDVPGDVADNFQTIVNNKNVTDILNTFIDKAAGNVVYDPIKEEFSYVENGVSHVINLKDFVGEMETITVLKNNGDGTYTYTNEAGDAVDIDVPGDVADNFQTIVNNKNVTDILNTFIDKAAGNVVYDPIKEEFSYVENGVSHVINLKEFVGEMETITVLKNNGDGTYTYTNEAGAAVKIDVPGDVADNFQTIVNNKNVTDILNTFIDKSAGNVAYDPIKEEFSYVENGVSHVINLKEFVGEMETITVLKNNGDGTYTYTNEAGAAVKIDVPGDVADNFQTIVNNQSVTDILNTFLSKAVGNVTYNSVTKEFSYTNAKGISEVINLELIMQNAETLTTLGINAITGHLDFKDEKAVVTEIDITSLVSEPWFSTVTNKGATTNLENIYTKGWVGIGYDVPSSNSREKLRVNGTITTINSTYADYVFEDYFDGFSELKMDYKFKSLDEVELFIKTNKHLPGITPIYDLEKTDAGYSFNMSELSIQLLEKTEELYLHIIELKNTIQEKDLELQKVSDLLKARLEKLEVKMNK